ncbi:hypothetical protein SELMODRAFT_418161 [Selaginella moellendorffii]|uniref:Peptidase M16 middle/third domain-containing protein n=1 Tax=Selaginella moellendorffii TaxID=88036 RepID=D8S4V5_SELML|nr:hypothetical protein SELMODRAFT_418161 [Selaginella moellendorffii]
MAWKVVLKIDTCDKCKDEIIAEIYHNVSGIKKLEAIDPLYVFTGEFKMAIDGPGFLSSRPLRKRSSNERFSRPEIDDRQYKSLLLSSKLHPSFSSILDVQRCNVEGNQCSGLRRERKALILEREPSLLRAWPSMVKEIFGLIENRSLQSPISSWRTLPLRTSTSKFDVMLNKSYRCPNVDYRKSSAYQDSSSLKASVASDSRVSGLQRSVVRLQLTISSEMNFHYQEKYLPFKMLHLSMQKFILLNQSTMAKIWFKPDHAFKTPKAYVAMNLKCPNAVCSLEANTLLTLFKRLPLDELNESAYYAELGGFWYSVTLVSTGFEVTTQEKCFRDQQNCCLESSMSQANDYCQLLLSNDRRLANEYIDAVSSLYPDDMQNMFQRHSLVSLASVMSGTSHPVKQKI